MIIHSQFKHIFHLKDPKHMWTGIWMLVLRTAKVRKEKDLWFIVNSVPIRYSLREMELILGLHCHSYPDNYERIDCGVKAKGNERAMLWEAFEDGRHPFSWGRFAFEQNLSSVSLLLGKADGVGESSWIILIFSIPLDESDWNVKDKDDALVDRWTKNILKGKKQSSLKKCTRTTTLPLQLRFKFLLLILLRIRSLLFRLP
ncbi:hypothetical protein N665_0681s0003 [Sinapis alba]|nr:hypothetical protein N665_0681s0003 [Sinapis alba]